MDRENFMKRTRVLAAAVLAAGGATFASGIADAAPTVAAHVLGRVEVHGDTASVRVRYICPEEGNHLWVSAKQVESRRADRRLQEEGSSAISAGWWQSHPTDFTCDGTWQTDTFTIGTFEFGIGDLERGVAWLQFCVTAGDEDLLINETRWISVS
jgi:hypothetical protein